MQRFFTTYAILYICNDGFYLEHHIHLIFDEFDAPDKTRRCKYVRLRMLKKSLHFKGVKNIYVPNNYPSLKPFTVKENTSHLPYLYIE